MPRYFFHVQDGILEVDEDGADFKDVGAAKLEAIRFGGELMRDFPGHFSEEKAWFVAVSDETGATVFRIRFSAVET